MKLTPKKNDNLTNEDNTPDVPNEVQILINDNSDTVTAITKSFQINKKMDTIKLVAL